MKNRIMFLFPLICMFCCCEVYANCTVFHAIDDYNSLFSTSYKFKQEYYIPSNWNGKVVNRVDVNIMTKSNTGCAKFRLYVGHDNIVIDASEAIEVCANDQLNWYSLQFAHGVTLTTGKWLYLECVSGWNNVFFGKSDPGNYPNITVWYGDSYQYYYPPEIDVRLYECDLNNKPIANAGADQPVDERTLVTLDGSASSDVEGSSLTYTWEQIAGTPVELDISDSVHPTFTAPEVPVGGETLSFQLTVSDGELTNTDLVNVVVRNVNHPPVAVIDVEERVAEGSPVSMSGHDSYDEDGDSLSYFWEQISGPTVILSDPTATNPSFIVPYVGPEGAELIFNLTVTDEIDSAFATASIFIENVNHPPIANAGEDQTKDEKSQVMLDASGSRDPDGDLLSYNWVQLSGPSVVLSDPTSSAPSFETPLVDLSGTDLVFQLTVDDGFGGINVDEVTIHVRDINDSPNCGLAKANPAIIWPPNHRLVPIEIANLTDPNNDSFTITWLSVTQDEPTNGIGDGDTSPDAVIRDGQCMVRAERAGGGDGRVYLITFRAEDSFGEICTGTVKVNVPQDKKKACIDSGQAFDSLTQ